MKGLRWAGVVVIIGTAAGALVFALMPIRYRGSSTIQFDCEGCRIPENVAQLGLVDWKLRRPVNDIRDRLLAERGQDTAITISPLNAQNQLTATLTISFEASDPDAAAREAARLARRWSDLFREQWEPARTSAVDMNIALPSYWPGTIRIIDGAPATTTVHSLRSF